jgi:2-polyprenyl-3-methyl-5-hydroxy-6-metoxy-1,4-benzoquinol methylase
MNTNSTCEYFYKTAESGHHHHYIFPALKKLLSKIKTNEHRQLRVLDIGCGNGSLSNLIAKEGYEVVGIEESLSGFTTATNSFLECKFIHANL